MARYDGPADQFRLVDGECQRAMAPRCIIFPGTIDVIRIGGQTPAASIILTPTLDQIATAEKRIVTLSFEVEMVDKCRVITGSRENDFRGSAGIIPPFVVGRVGFD